MLNEILQSDLKQAYSRNNWQQWLQNIFAQQIVFETQPEQITLQKGKAKSIERFASISLVDGKNLAVLDIVTDKDVQIARNRVALREIGFQLIDHDRYHGLLAFYHSEDTTQQEYRLSFISSETVIDENGNFTIQNTNPKRFTYVLGENESTRTVVERLKKIAEKAGNITLEDVKDAFSVETLTKEFYKELFDWYQWALSDEMGVTYPNDTSTEADDRIIQEHLIRLITRLIFVWFIKQKKLISNEIFDVINLQDILKDFNPMSNTEGNYYNAILQNLFFATLNRPVNERKFATDKNFQGKDEHYGIKTLFRNANEGNYFKKSQEEIIELFKQAPFLNGGLFECLDKEQDKNGKIFYYDGFSRAKGRQKRAFIPNCLFFDKDKGLLSILKRYNFTIEENTPNDVDVALDPELLGKVFENLLGYYNPETKESARKQSGSFYTPREIVNYMVDESIRAYLQQAVNDITDVEIDKYPSLSDETKQKIYNALLKIKILDPACGSGAFPMGILNQFINIFEKILPEDRRKSIYELKLHLIENCIYGIDIQTIAIQISKLRFFISLMCEQTSTSDADSNYGIKLLPNLETKFVAADTLIGIAKKTAQGNLFEDPQIEVTKKSLLEVRHEHFSADTAQKKKECRTKDKQLRENLANLLENNNMFAPEDAKQLAKWNPYDQNSTWPFFDPEWMFGLTQGFDIVIGNPPYVQLQKNGGELSKLYGPKKERRKTIPSPYQTFHSMGDLYSLFYERGYQLLKQGGHLCFITSNKWMRAGYGENTRKFFSEN
ncbi:MAG: Eco57I restriction-modification methylase domain-containing protein, partial [Bacteroidales bacterium]|nr:Eco57I restriction-modification methylase domain-containing protein [Bacteroidales bacterium]